MRIEMFDAADAPDHHAHLRGSRLVLSAADGGRTETYVIGGNEEAARFSGLRVGWIKLRTYALAGLAAGVGGLVSLGRLAQLPPARAPGMNLL